MRSAQPGPAESGGLPEHFEQHPGLDTVRFLIGRWEGAGVVGYPTIESANFGQEITFSHNGKPFLIYASRTWLIEPDGTIGRPLAMETGYWRPQEDGGIEVVLAHPTGITEIYIGAVTGTKIELATDAVVRTATAKEVTAGRRLYGLIGADLGWAYDMAAVGQPLQSHVSAQLKRVSRSLADAPAGSSTGHGNPRDDSRAGGVPGRWESSEPSRRARKTP